MLNSRAKHQATQFAQSSRYEQHEHSTGNDHEIDIWSWPLLASPLYVSALAEILSADEIARAGRFIRQADVARFICARGNLRKILALYCRISAPGISFNYNEYGKPALGNASRNAVNFNLSHSGNYAVLAVSTRFELGIDIEEIKPFDEDVAARFFSKSEYAELAKTSDEDYLDAFYRCWTRKEAFVKAHGFGLALSLDSFDVTVQKNLAPKIIRLEGVDRPWAEWQLMNINLPDNYAGALAAHTRGQKACLVYRHF